MVDVPAALACRARKLSGHSARKTDEFDARAVAIAATYNRGLRRVQADNVSAVLGLLVERRWQLVSQRQRTICQLHALLTDMVAAGAKGHLTSKKAAALLRTIPAGDVVTLERKLLARELIDDVRRLDRRIPPARRRLTAALTAYGTTLTNIHGIGDVGAATIIGIVDDPRGFPPAATSPRSPAPRRCKPPPATSNATDCRGAATANSTRCCTPPPKPRSAAAVPAATTTNANSPRARAAWRRCALSNGSCPTWSTAGCSPTTSNGRSGVDR